MYVRMDLNVFGGNNEEGCTMNGKTLSGRDLKTNVEKNPMRIFKQFLLVACKRPYNRIRLLIRDYGLHRQVPLRK